MEKKAQHKLSLNFIKKVNAKADKHEGVILQIISVKYPSAEEKYGRAVLSDGHFKCDFIMSEESANRMRREHKEHEVILCNAMMAFKYDQVIRILLKFKVIVRNVKDIIGKPLEYQKDQPDRENPLGCIIVPEEIYEEDEDLVRLSQELEKTQIPLPGSKSNQPTVNRREVEGTHSSRDRRHSVERQQPRQRDPVRKVAAKSVGRKEYYTPIDQISPKLDYWTIKGRIVKKTLKRTFVRNGKESSVFSIVIRDKTKSIMGTFFGDASNRFYDQLEEKAVYTFKRGNVSLGNAYNRADHKYCITFNTNAEIVEVSEDTSLPCTAFNFVTLDKVSCIQGKRGADVIGEIVEDRGVKPINTVNGKRDLREVIIVDDTQYCLKISLWEEAAYGADFTPGEILAISDLYIDNTGNFNRASFSKYSKWITDYQFSARYKELKEWMAADIEKNILNTDVWDRNYQIVSIRKMRRRATRKLKKKELGEKPAFYTICAFLSRISRDPFYEGCPIDTCNKKLVIEGKNKLCPKCNEEKMTSRLIFFSKNLLQDGTDGVECMSIGENQCMKFLGKPIEELMEMRDEDVIEYQNYISHRMYDQYKFRIKVSKDNFNHKVKLKYNIVSATRIEDIAHDLIKYFEQKHKKDDKKLREKTNDRVCMDDIRVKHGLEPLGIPANTMKVESFGTGRDDKKADFKKKKEPHK